MKDIVNTGSARSNMPILMPCEPQEFLNAIRQIIREEVRATQQQTHPSTSIDTNGLSYKPIFKLSEVCDLFQVSKPTIYEWIKHGKLKPFKVRSRVYFLRQDIEDLLPMRMVKPERS